MIAKFSECALEKQPLGDSLSRASFFALFSFLFFLVWGGLRLKERGV